MKKNSYLDSFLHFEYEYNLFEKQIGGIYIWEYIRNRFYYEGAKQYGQLINAMWEKEKESMSDEMKEIKAFKKRLVQLPKLIYIIIKRIMLGSLKQKDLLVMNFQRRYPDGEFYDCKYTDEYLSKTNFSYYVLESSSDHNIFHKIRTKNLIYPQLSYQLVRLLKMFEEVIFLRRKGITVEENKCINNIIENFNKWFKLNYQFDRLSLKTEIKKIIMVHEIWETVYKKIIKKVKPKAIIYVARHAYNRKIISEMAKKENIPTIEFQHGLMGREHISFNFLKKYPLKTYPEYIFSFGELWKKNVRFPIDDDHVIPTGMAYFEKKMIPYKMKPKENHEKKTILFLSQASPFEKLSDLACRLYDMLDGNRYNIIFKLHPLELQNFKIKKRKFEDRDIEVVGNSEYDLYYYFSICDCVIGVFSTTLFEAIAFNVPIFIYKIEGYELLNMLYENNYANLISAPDDFIKLIKKIDSNDSKLVNENGSQAIWQSNVIQNIDSAINDIILKKKPR